MRILQDHQYRLFACKRLDRPTQRFKGLLPTLLRRQVERAIASIVRQRQERLLGCCIGASGICASAARAANAVLARECRDCRSTRRLAPVQPG
jgi:hypothetical protein